MGSQKNIKPIKQISCWNCRNPEWVKHWVEEVSAVRICFWSCSVTAELQCKVGRTHQLSCRAPYWAAPLKQWVSLAGLAMPAQVLSSAGSDSVAGERSHRKHKPIQVQLMHTALNGWVLQMILKQRKMVHTFSQMQHFPGRTLHGYFLMVFLHLHIHFHRCQLHG